MTNDVPGSRQTDKSRTVIPTSRALHRGPVGFAIFVVDSRGGQIELDPPTADARKVLIDKDGAQALRDALIE